MKRSDFAVASLVLGIISFLQLLGAERAIAAIVFGTIALWKISKEPELRGRWMAIVGIVLGIIYLVSLGIYFPQIMQMLRKLAG